MKSALTFIVIDYVNSIFKNNKPMKKSPLFSALGMLFCGMCASLVSCGPVLNPPADDQPSTQVFDMSGTRPLTTDNRVIYELNLYNFTQEGTFAAAQDKLEQLRSLGIDIVWLMPLQTRSKQGKIGQLGSPYALRNYTEVNPDHGTLDDMKAFVNKAHELGMEVWMDWVPNHTGLDNVWVTEHRDFYKQQNGQIVHPNNYGDVYQLDYSNQQMQDAMIDAMKYWITNADIDGFRFDYISSKEIPLSFWQKAIPAIKAAPANGKRIWTLAEGDLADRTDLYQAGFDYDYAWGFHSRLQNFGKGTAASSLQASCEWLINNNRYSNIDRMVYLTNHDDIGDNFSANYFSYLGDNVLPLTVLEFTLYGMPLIYNGQEIGYKKVQNYFNRDVINWTTADKKTQNTIATLIALRHTQPALAGSLNGNRPTTTFLRSDNAAFLAYTKKKDNNEVLVIINLSQKDETGFVIGITEGKYTQWLNANTISTQTEQTNFVSLKSTMSLTLPAKGYAVYVYDYNNK